MTATHPPQTPDHSLAPGASLLHALARNWWLEVLRGVAAIIFGVLAFAWPGITLLTLVLFWGAFALVDGVLAIIAAVKGGNPMPRWWLAIVGVAGIAAGALTFLMPGVTLFVLLIFIAVWAIILGVMEVYGAIKLRKEIEGEWFLILNGLLSVVFGILLLWRPGIGALALVWIIGAYAIILGVIYVAFGLKLKKHAPAA
ncbi:MAG: HdeD family acid-resistance protein [Xanthobacteraceae bacterium]|nr:HdeD family acid-resistance protein [Xanthobacteraceae bacterium]